jgi:hypothetical protein
MEETTRLEAKIPLSGWEGNPPEGCHPSNSDV